SGTKRQRVGRIAEAMQFYLEARDLYERLVREHPDVADYQFRLSRELTDIGALQENSGHADQAIPSIGKRMELLQAGGRQHRDRLYSKSLLALNLRWTGQIYHRRTKPPANAIPYYRRAIELYEPLVRQNPEVKTYPLQLAYSICYLAQVLRRT